MWVPSWFGCSPSTGGLPLPCLGNCALAPSSRTRLGPYSPAVSARCARALEAYDSKLPVSVLRRCILCLGLAAWISRACYLCRVVTLDRALLCSLLEWKVGFLNGLHRNLAVPFLHAGHATQRQRAILRHLLTRLASVGLRSSSVPSWRADDPIDRFEPASTPPRPPLSARLVDTPAMASTCDPRSWVTPALRSRIDHIEDIFPAKPVGVGSLTMTDRSTACWLVDCSSAVASSFGVGQVGSAPSSWYLKARAASAQSGTEAFFLSYASHLRIQSDSQILPLSSTFWLPLGAGFSIQRGMRPLSLMCLRRLWKHNAGLASLLFAHKRSPQRLRSRCPPCGLSWETIA